jgi:hypothetical protein
MNYINASADESFYTFNGKCAFCNKDVIWKVRYKWKLSSAEDPYTWFFVGECPVCGYPSFAVTFDDGTGKYGIFNIYPTVTLTKIPRDLPDNLKKIYDIITSQLYVEKADQEVVSILCKNMLEVIIAEQDFEGCSFQESIDKLEIPDMLKDFLKTTQVGNMNTKELLSTVISKDEVMNLWESLKILIEYLYILPARIRSITKESVK